MDRGGGRVSGFARPLAIARERRKEVVVERREEVGVEREKCAARRRPYLCIKLASDPPGVWGGLGAADAGA